MKIERTKNTTRNMMAGVFLRLYQMIGPFVLRTVMIYMLGMEYVGLNSLFTSILHMLNLAELGVGSALVYSMYKPLADKNYSKLTQLMKLYRDVYRIIGAVVLLGAIGGLIASLLVHSKNKKKREAEAEEEAPAQPAV